MAKLIFIDEKFGGRIYEFALPKTTIGRGDHNTLIIHDNVVSQTHCEILVFGPEVIVRDLGSSNGTFVNGVRLHNEQRPLLAGQIVKFGSVTARLELEEPTTDPGTDETAILSYAQYRREQQNQSKTPANAAMTLQSAPESTSMHHTLLLPRSPAAETNRSRAT